MRLEAQIASKSVRAANGAPIDVLRELSIEAGEGELVALLGPSGCGKTTLLKCIAGLDGDYEGRIAWEKPPRLGMVFQEPRLLPWRTVEENVRIAAPTASDDLINRLMDMLRLQGHRQHFPGELSLGLARRVALARAFAVEPDVLLLDEPFVSLDAPLARELRGELIALLDRQPATVILVTHDVAEAAELADRVLLLSARPARVVESIAIAQGRGKRSASQIADIAARISQRAVAAAGGA